MAHSVKMKVEPFSVTPDAEYVCAAAAKQCYNPVDAVDILCSLTSEDAAKMIDHIMKSGHRSVLAHASVGIAVSGCSRSFLAQVTRHTHIKPSVQSQQYINHKDFGFNVPTTINNHAKALDMYRRFMEYSQDLYALFINEFGIPHEDARQLLNNAVEARMVLTGTLWAWFEMLQKRLCNRNTEEIIHFSQLTRDLLMCFAPNVFKYCSPPCAYGKCTEVKSCGKPYPKIDFS